MEKRLNLGGSSSVNSISFLIQAKWMQNNQWPIGRHRFKYTIFFHNLHIYIPLTLFPIWIEWWGVRIILTGRHIAVGKNCALQFNCKLTELNDSSQSFYIVTSQSIVFIGMPLNAYWTVFPLGIAHKFQSNDVNYSIKSAVRGSHKILHKRNGQQNAGSLTLIHKNETSILSCTHTHTKKQPNTNGAIKQAKQQAYEQSNNLTKIK